jgi:hypothetical protein
MLVVCLTLAPRALEIDAGHRVRGARLRHAGDCSSERYLAIL